jgi:predicted DNA-binding transcriptional regulator AlpA
MKTSIFTPQVAELIINEEQRCFITSVSRSHVFQLERQGLFPRRINLDTNTNGWKLREVLAWLRSRPIVELKQIEVCNDTI